MNIFIKVVMTVVTCTAAYALYKKKDTIKGFYANRKGSSNTNAMKDVCNAFLQYTDVFQGLYEPMYKASKGSISKERIYNVLTEWDIRMNNIGNIPSPLKGWWLMIIENKDNLDESMLIERTKEIMNMVFLSGIVRDARKEFIADNNTNVYYDSLEDPQFSIGQHLRVETPCWFINYNPVRIIEKGICETL